MPVGRLQLQRISTPGEVPETYQVSHLGLDGGQFVGSVQKDHLGKFLHETLRMEPGFVERLLDELYLRGHADIPQVSILESDLAASGLQHLPDDR
jgi:hypothetical protein